MGTEMRVLFSLSSQLAARLVNVGELGAQTLREACARLVCVPKGVLRHLVDLYHSCGFLASFPMMSKDMSSSIRNLNWLNWERN